MRDSIGQRSRNTLLPPRLLSTATTVLIGVLLVACGQESPAPAAEPVGQTEAAEIEITNELLEAANAEGTLYIRYSAQQEATEAIIDDFADQYNIEVIRERRAGTDGSEAFLSEARAGTHIVDVHINTDAQSYQPIIEEGYYAPYRVPTTEDYPSEVILAEYAIAPYYSEMGLTYNSTLLSDGEAQALFRGTWDGLLDERFADSRIGMRNPYASSLSTVWFAALQEDPAYGSDFLDEVAAQEPLIIDDTARAAELLAAGEVTVLIGDALDPHVARFADGSPVHWVHPDILPAYGSTMTFLATNAPNPNAARLFLAWYLGEEGAQSIASAGRQPSIEIPVDVDLPVFDQLAETSWYEPYPVDARYLVSPDQKATIEEQFRPRMVELFDIPQS